MPAHWIYKAYLDSVDNVLVDTVLVDLWNDGIYKKIRKCMSVTYLFDGFDHDLMI